MAKFAFKIRNMATGGLLDTKTVNLNEILGNGKVYRVPIFQRDYSWEQDNWEDLWNDIEIAAQSGKAHYMGSVVLQSGSGKDYLIIDGQQRFTTLSILALAVIDAINQLKIAGNEPTENSERFDILMRQYIGHKDPSSLTYSSKLFLNENNDGFYQNRLVGFKEPIQVGKLSDSERLMWDAYLFFKSKIDTKFRAKEGSALALYLNNAVGDLMMFIQITVQDELNAYTVFETLNSRGVELTATDLLKNYLFSLVVKSASDLKIVKTQWNKTIEIIGLKEFPTFLRHFLMATRKLITKEYLFKEIKNFIKNDQDVFNLLDQLQLYSYNYVALGNPDDELWNSEKEIRNAISVLKAFKVTQWKPLAMVAAEKFDQKDLRRLLNSILIISYRYNVIAKMQTNEMEKTYCNAAISLYKNLTKDASSAIGSLQNLYINDDEFKHYFSSKQFNTNSSSDKKLLRYTLYKLESQEDGGSLYDFETDNGTIEHILPESYAEVWHGEFTEEEYERNVNMLGNLTLLEPSKNNKDAADKAFEEKKKVYASSKYAQTSKIADYQWTPKSIRNRQAHLANLATSIWRISF